MKRVVKRGCIALVMVVVYLLAVLLIPPAIRPTAEPAELPTAATGERVAWVEDNVEALVWRLRMIEAAQQELILATFDFGTGRAGQDIMAALLNAAQRGVQVKLLLDGYNSGETLKSPEFQALAANPGVEVRVYNPVNVLTLWDVNFRMHDKYLMADGKMYLLGGRNTNNLFLGSYSDTPNIDLDILVWGTDAEGSGGQLKAYFRQVWQKSQPKQCGFSDQSALQSRYEGLKTAYPEAFGFTDWEDSTVPAQGVSLICGQIQPSAKAPLVWNQLCQIMAKGHRVLIQTPYAICDKKMYGDVAAIVEGGTQLELLTNSPETGANPFGCADLRNQRQNLLDTGMTLLEYAGDQSLHSKIILIDDTISIVGSYNLDMRSTYLSTETMLVVDCRALNQALRAKAHALATESLRTTADGTELPGVRYVPKAMDREKAMFYGLLGFISPPFRYLM